MHIQGRCSKVSSLIYKKLMNLPFEAYRQKNTTLSIVTASFVQDLTFVECPAVYFERRAFVKLTSHVTDARY